MFRSEHLNQAWIEIRSIRNGIRVRRSDAKWLLHRIWHTARLPHRLAWTTCVCALFIVRHRLARPGRRAAFMGRTRCFGDLVTLEPLARQLQTEGRAVAWLVERPYAPVIALFPSVDQVIRVPCKTALAFLAWLFGLDAVLLMHFEGTHCPICFVAPRLHPKNDAVTATNYYGNGRSLLAAFTETAGIQAKLRQPRLVRPDASKTADIVVNPGPTDSTRVWREERWLEFLERVLSEYDVRIAAVGTKRLIALDHPRFLDLSGQQTIVEAAATIAAARLFIGVDSGPAHFANAYEVPGIVLAGQWRGFGAYVPYDGFYAERGNLSIVRSPRDAEEIAVDEMLKVFRESWTRLR